MEYLPIGTVLFTKDGRNVGNSIIVDVQVTPPSALLFPGMAFYSCVSDYGNAFRATHSELCRLFHIGHVDTKHKNFPKPTPDLPKGMMEFFEGLNNVSDAMVTGDPIACCKAIDGLVNQLQNIKLQLFDQTT